MAKKKAKKTTAKKAGKLVAASARRRTTDFSDDDVKTVDVIDKTANRIEKEINKRILPELKFPVRSLSNVTYDKKEGYLKIGAGVKARHMSVNTVKNFAQTLRLMALSKQMIVDDKYATKRDAYYVSKNWGECKFNEQAESDSVMDDVEALASREGLTREALRYHPEDHGGTVAGELTVIDRDKQTGNTLRIDCTKMGSGAYSIPHSVEHLGFETKADFILVIETGGMFSRLNDNEFWKDANCILIGMGGVPTRATRRFVRRLSESKRGKIPVYAFVDCDPYGIANIYRTLKVGSGNAAHINQFFCVPNAQFLGVTPQDVIDFNLEKACHDLQPVDIKRAKDALKNDPFFMSHPKWKKALNQMLKSGKRAEQQALTLWGLDYVIEEYLPRKLNDRDSFLP